MNNQDNKTTPSSEKEGDTRNITDILPSAQYLLSKRVPIQEPPISVELVDYIMTYIEENPHIRSVAVIGFNKGMHLEFCKLVFMSRINRRILPESKRRCYCRCIRSVGTPICI